MSRINLIFPDGSIVTGKSYREVEDALRASQWHTYKSRREFRQEMRRRAAMWSGCKPKPIAAQSSKQFIYHLVHNGLCMIEVNYPHSQEKS